MRISSLLKKTGNRLQQLGEQLEGSQSGAQLDTDPLLDTHLPGMPIVLGNSFPKSGTHLLGKLLKLIGLIELDIMALDHFFWDHNKQGDLKDWEALGDSISDFRNPLRVDCAFHALAPKLREGQFLFSHVTPLPQNITTIRDYGIKHLLIVRDPRDIAVSYMRHVTYMPHKFPPLLEHYVCRAFESDEKRLSILLKGIPQQGFMCNIFENIFLHRLQWLNEPGVLVLKFEELVGSKGGGDDLQQLDTICRIFKFLGINVSENSVSTLQAQLFGGDTHTFNKGQIGVWREVFNQEHVDLFKSTCKGLLEQLGYEKDDCWDS